MNDNRKTVIVAALAAVLMACVAVAQTHYNLTNNQNFTTANGKSLTGTYQCGAGGTIQDCALSGVTLTTATLTSPTITGGTLTGTTWKSGSFGGNASGDGVFTCVGSNIVSGNNNCYFPGSIIFGDNGAGSLSGVVQFSNGFTSVGTNNFTTQTTTFSNTSTLSISGTLLVNTLATISATKTVRASGGAADCNLTFTRGILTSTTC